MALEGSHEEHITINGTILTGVQNVSFEQAVSDSPVAVLGNDFGGTMISGPTIVEASVDKLLLNGDFVTGLTGLTTISGQFEYGGNFLDFSSAVINNYSVGANIGALPEISFDLSIYGGLSGSNTSVRSSASTENAIEEISQHGLIVTFDKGATNAVQSFTFSEVFNFQPMYSVGQENPADIALVGPIAQEATISIEVEDYEFEETFSFLGGSKDRNRTIQLQISGNNGVLNTFSLESGHLVSESLSAGAGDTIIANLNYRGFKKV